MTEEQITTMEESLENTPEEVRDFIFGEEMLSAKNEINTHLETDEQRAEVSSQIIFFLLEGIEIEELTNTINTLSIADEKKGIIKTLIQEKIINELLLTIEARQEIDAESGPVTTPVSSAPTPTEVLATLSTRLSQSSVIVPSKRDYSTAAPITPVPEKPTVQNITPSIDPYRELPEK